MTTAENDKELIRKAKERLEVEPDVLFEEVVRRLDAKNAATDLFDGIERAKKALNKSKGDKNGNRA